jgi:eukaryotic-like serine/threonine-protein kinase
MDIRPGATLNGPSGKKITIDAVIARGGLGQVFAGTLPDSTRVAVKTVLTAPLDDDELVALQNEAKHASAIAHTNVVRVLHVEDGSETGHPPYIVMEYVEGGTLRTIIDQHRVAKTKIPVDELRALFLQIALGMAAINEHIVHRDLKPENVLFESASGVLKVADFGLAKLADAATRSVTFKGWGTRPYQAPEAFEHGPNTVRMDIYSAGVLFFELATLEWPLAPRPGDNSPLAWRHAHLLSPPKDVSIQRADLPIELRQLIMLMLQKDPSRRPESFQTVAERLNANRHGPSGPDVTALVAKATDTLGARTAADARAREARERQAERVALLEQAFNEPRDVLVSLVEAYNAATLTDKLGVDSRTPWRLVVTSPTGHRKLVLDGNIVDDIDTRSDGIARLVLVVGLEPPPQPRDANEAIMNRESFGSFNLVYRVKSPQDRFGEWIQLRFEQNPLIRGSTYPRWFGLSFAELPPELSLLRAVGQYQHQQRTLDDAWFRDLLLQLL